jgi:hypothetical protein
VGEHGKRIVTSISRTRVGRRAAIGVVIAAALVCALATLPGTQRSAAAAAIATPAPTLDAGLAGVRTVQGVFVFDGQDGDAAYAVDRVAFAAAANGDRYFDIRYKPDYAALQKEWRAAVKADPHASITDLEARSLGALARQVLVVSGQRGLEQMKSWVVNPITHKVIGVRYRYYAGLFSSYPLAAAPPRSVQYVWALSTVLDTERASQGQRVTIAATPLAGGPAHGVTAFAGAKPAYEALIDRYGLTEQVTTLVGSRALQPFRLIPFHLESLEVNRAIAPSLFVMKPDYRYAPRGYGRPKASDTPAKYGIELGERAIPLADLNRFTSSWTLLPTWLPAGYRLAQAVEPGPGSLRLVYRSGLLQLQVGTAGRGGVPIAVQDTRRGWIFDATGSDDERGWYGWATIGHGIGLLRAGAMAGWPAAKTWVPEPGRNAVDTVAFGVSGTASTATLRRVAESLRPAQPGQHLPSFGPTWLIRVALAAAAALLVTVALQGRRRAAGSTSWPGRACLSLIGVAVVVLGASLSWHRLYGGGNHFAVRGWQEPLAVATVAVALLAGATGLWSPVASRRWVTPRFLAFLLGLATLAGTIVALVYLPLKARFLVDYSAAPRWTSLHSLLDYLRGTFCPAPGPGLYLSIAGAIVIVIGAWRLRAAKQA